MLKPVSEYCSSVADGSRYVNSESNPYWETEKYHQLWVLNTRVKENLGFYKNSENPLTAYREKYEAEHPLDNSRAGYLARISGITKYDAETVIAIADYYQQVANYHPEDAYQFAPRDENSLAANLSADFLAGSPSIAAKNSIAIWNTSVHINQAIAIAGTSKTLYHEVSA